MGPRDARRYPCLYLDAFDLPQPVPAVSCFPVNKLGRIAGTMVAAIAMGTGCPAAPPPPPIERIWLSHASHDVSRITVCWETVDAGDSTVEYGATAELGQRARNDNPTRLHHVEILAPVEEGPWHYRVRSGETASRVIGVRGWESGCFRAAIVGDLGFARADWATAVLRERPHLLLTAGDNVPSLHEGSPVSPDNMAAFRRLIDCAPGLFQTTPFMPVLGNHDRELRPRGPKPPPDPVYDVGASAFRKFFALPGDEWKWTFDIPAFGARFVAVDLNHVQDLGTTWQTCHDFRAESAQLEWYRRTMADSPHPFVITVYNERHATVRSLERGAWWPHVRGGSAAVTGFGYFAERAMADGFPCVNTSVSGKGDRYPDPASVFVKGEDNFVLLTFLRGDRARMELTALSGEPLDAIDLAPRTVPVPEAGPAFRAISCNGAFPNHLQGICTDDRGSIYWSWTDALVKTDLAGRELKRVVAANHHGDLCHHEGRIFVAVNLGKFNLPPGSEDSWVYVYDASSLKELARHKVPEVVHGAGGIAHHDGKFIVVGGLPKGVPENYVYEYDEDFAFRARHALQSGNTLMGIQTTAYANGAWWFGCYGEPRILLRTDDAFQLTGKWEYDAAYGIAPLPDGRFLIGRSTQKKGLGHRGRVLIVRPDHGSGLVIVDGQ